jgi:phosphate/sulfate permease
LLILTCSGVSFFHGGNDGQKGMGLIMLILIGTVPTAYALNRTMHEQDVSNFVAVSAQAQTALSRYGVGAAPADPHAAAMAVVRSRSITPQGVSALAALAESISIQVNQYHSMDKVPPGSMVNIRNDMYLVSEGLRYMGKAKSLHVSEADKSALDAYKKQLDHSTKFIPTWVKVAVAIALGLGTMIGWKRCDGHDRRRGNVWPAGQHHARAVVGRGGNDGRESVRPAMGDSAQFIDGLGAHVARLDHARRQPVLAATPLSVRRQAVLATPRR